MERLDERQRGTRETIETHYAKKSDLSDMRTELHKDQRDFTLRMIGFLAVTLGAGAGITLAMVRIVEGEPASPAIAARPPVPQPPPESSPNCCVWG